MAKSVFFDTQIITGVSDGTLPATVWATIIGKLSGTYEYCASFTTFVELINALAEGDEARFDQNRKRLMLLTSPSGCRLLPMPGQFIRNKVFGLPTCRPEYSPERLQQSWIPIIKAARTKADLSSGDVVMASLPRGIDLTFGIDLPVLRRYMNDGKALWCEELRLAKEGEKAMPPADLHAKFILRYDVFASETEQNIKLCERALDAAYCHLARIHLDCTRGEYRFERNDQDWIDNQQLMYLADPELTFVTSDKRLIAKLGKSVDRNRVLEFTEFARAI
ncbi:MAG TPA: hypothetical protein VN682_16160 [Terriglobales bacterium]|jgi:hypothetical protein|nr:hypothetical protein [Terriglobales bacterium]